MKYEKGETKKNDKYMTNDAVEKHAIPMDTWTKKVRQKFSVSKNILSETKVITPENNKYIQPDGKHL